MSYRSAFKTPEDEATYLAAYDDAMKLWPVSYEEMAIPSRFGMTHVVVSGQKDGAKGGFITSERNPVFPDVEKDRIQSVKRLS